MYSASKIIFFLKWLCTAGVIFGRLEFKFNKLKEFWWIDYVMDTRKRDSLACFLNMTPFLERLLVKVIFFSRQKRGKKQSLGCVMFYCSVLYSDVLMQKFDACYTSFLYVI